MLVESGLLLRFDAVAVVSDLQINEARAADALRVLRIPAPERGRIAVLLYTPGPDEGDGSAVTNPRFVSL